MRIIFIKDQELPGVFSLQAAAVQEAEVEGCLVGGLEKLHFNGSSQLLHDSHYPQFVWCFYAKYLHFEGIFEILLTP